VRRAGSSTTWKLSEAPRSLAALSPSSPSVDGAAIGATVAGSSGCFLPGVRSLNHVKHSALKSMTLIRAQH